MTIHLKNDLDILHRDLLAMSGIVEEMVHQAAATLSDPSFEAARALSERDNEIDKADVRLEEHCLRLLALHQPVAIDLRRITSVMKITGELERVADLAVHIAERACGLIGVPDLLIPEKLRTMVEVAVEMLHRSIDAYVRLDSRLARDICGEDETVDSLNRDVIDELREVMADRPDNLEAALHLFSASRHIERVADHATNIAEDVVYLVDGVIIRHRAKLNDTSSAASSSP